MSCFALAFLALAAISQPAAAGWREDATPRDVQRLEQLSESRAKVLLEAANAPARDAAVIRSILDTAAVAADASRFTGTWKCRTIKLGGMTPAVVYSWFTCRITIKDGKLFFEKLGGSQRTQGALYPDGGGFVYLGASSVHYAGKVEAPHRYSGTGASAGAADTPDDQIALLSLLADGRARLEFPYPVQESTFDIIELKR